MAYVLWLQVIKWNCADLTKNDSFAHKHSIDLVKLYEFTSLGRFLSLGQRIYCYLMWTFSSAWLFYNSGFENFLQGETLTRKLTNWAFHKPYLGRTVWPLTELVNLPQVLLMAPYVLECTTYILGNYRSILTNGLNQLCLQVLNYIVQSSEIEMGTGL